MGHKGKSTGESLDKFSFSLWRNKGQTFAPFSYVWRYLKILYHQPWGKHSGKTGRAWVLESVMCCSINLPGARLAVSLLLCKIVELLLVGSLVTCIQKHFNFHFNHFSMISVRISMIMVPTTSMVHLPWSKLYSECLMSITPILLHIWPHLLIDLKSSVLATLLWKAVVCSGWPGSALRGPGPLHFPCLAQINRSWKTHIDLP